MPGFGPASAPVASCGVLGFLEALNSYRFDYISFVAHLFVNRSVRLSSDAFVVVFAIPPCFPTEQAGQNLAAASS